jgi:phage terminase small subunit
MENKNDPTDPITRLSAKQEKFAVLYVAYRRPGDAYARVYNVKNMSQNTIHSEASELLRNPKVAKRIAELRAEVAKNFNMEAVDVFKQWVDIATADPADLIKYRRVCCRFCYGVDNSYQWIDQNEYANAIAAAIDKQKPTPQLAGGFGFIKNKEPNENCKQCAGEGHENIYITPTNKLSPQAKLLYAGIKKTRDGVQILMRNQDEALVNIARFLGMQKQEIKLTTEADNAPIIKISTITTDQTLAAQIYQKKMAEI